MVYLTGLAWAAAAAALYRWRPATYLGVFLAAATTVFHAGWLTFGLLTALGGAAVAASRLAKGPGTERTWQLVRSPVSLGLALLLIGVWLSFLVNRHDASPVEVAAMYRDAKAITLAVAAYLAGFGLATSFRRVRLAVWALVVASLVLAGLRVAQMVGLDVTGLLNESFGTTILGDYGPYAQQNSYGTFLTLVLALGLYAMLRSRERWTVLAAAGGLSLVFQWLLLDSYARTGILSYAIVLVGALALARGRNRRVVLLVGAAFVVLALVHLWMPVSKPVVAAPQSLGTAVVGAAVPPAVRRVGREPILWSTAVAHPRFAIVQRIRVPEILGPDNVVRLFMRYPPWNKRGHTDIEIDGRVVRRLEASSREISRRGFFWLEVPVSRELLDGKRWVNVTIRVRGELDSRANYVEVAGGRFTADGLHSELFNGYGYLTDDLSAWRGWQQGTFLIFLNEYWPERFQLLRPGSRFALDNSIIERAVWARVALANYAAHPFVGSGFGSLVFRAPAYIGTSAVFAEFVNAHSNFFQVLSECGPIGFAGWLVVVFAPIGLTVARRWRRGGGPIGAPFDLAFGGFALAWALASVTQYTITDTRLFHVWLFYLGVWAAQFHRRGYGLVPWPRALARKTVGVAMDGGAAGRWGG